MDIRRRAALPVPALDDLPGIELELEGGWECRSVTFRQYVQLEEQACEVRLTGDISNDALSAIRTLGLEAIRNGGEPVPEALVVFTIIDEKRAHGFFGTDSCSGHTNVSYTLADGADPNSSEAWAASYQNDQAISVSRGTGAFKK